jgi:Ca2+-binding EF-hand superfamily protein
MSSTIRDVIDEDDGFASWIAEDDETTFESRGNLFRLPTPPHTPRANSSTGRPKFSAENTRPSSNESTASTLESLSTDAGDGEDFLAIDPIAAQALHDLQDALEIAIETEDYLSAAELKKLSPKLETIGVQLASQQMLKMKAIETEDYDTAQLMHDRLQQGRQSLSQKLRHIYSYRMLQRRRIEKEHAGGGGKAEHEDSLLAGIAEGDHSDDEDATPLRSLCPGQSVEARLDTWPKHCWMKGVIQSVNILKKSLVTYNVRFRDARMKEELAMKGGYFSSTDITGRVIEGLRQDQIRCTIEKKPLPPPPKKKGGASHGKWATVRRHFQHRTLKGADEQGEIARAVENERNKLVEEQAKIVSNRKNYKQDEDGGMVAENTLGTGETSKIYAERVWAVGDVVAAQLPRWKTAYGGKIMVVDEEKEEYTICFDDVNMQKDFMSKSHSGHFARVIEGVPKGLVRAMYPEHEQRYLKQYDWGIIKQKPPVIFYGNTKHRMYKETDPNLLLVDDIVSDNQGEMKKKKRFFGKPGDVFQVRLPKWPCSYGGRIVTIDTKTHTCSILFNDKRLLAANAPVRYRRVIEDIPESCIKPISSSTLRRYANLKSTLGLIKTRAKQRRQKLLGPSFSERTNGYKSSVERKKKEKEDRDEKEEEEFANTFCDYARLDLVEVKLPAWKSQFGGTVLSICKERKTMNIRFDDFKMKMGLSQTEMQRTNIRFGRVIESVPCKYVKQMEKEAVEKYIQSVNIRIRKAGKCTHDKDMELEEEDNSLSYADRQAALKQRQREKFLHRTRRLQKNVTWFDLDIYKEFELHAPETDVDSRATKIQAIYRGRRARKTIMETDLQTKQATKIQARVRGNQARQKKKKSPTLATIPPGVSKGKVEDGMKKGEGKDKKLVVLWNTLDVDGSGMLTFDELKTGFAKMGMKMDDKQLHQLANFIDKDKSGLISFEEFKVYLDTKKQRAGSLTPKPSTDKHPMATKSRSNRTTMELTKTKKARVTRGEEGEDKKLVTLWNTLDVDGSGMLTFDELKTGFAKMGMKMDDKQLHQLANFIDKDKSGLISFKEFKVYLDTKKRNRGSCDVK